VAVVTGANHGIGLATARQLAAAGARVFVTYLRLPVPDDDLTDTRRRYAELHATAVPDWPHQWEADLADPATIPALFDRVEAELGPIEILVNNADHCVSDSFLPTPPDLSPGGGPVQPFSAANWDAHSAVNCRAPGLAIAEFARRHVERGAGWGRIINISTDAAHSFPGEISYGASKFAIESMTRSAACELGRYGITANIVSPGPIQTGYITPDAMRDIAAATPLGRVGEPDDVAEVIAFLCSDAARWLTGQILYVGGGWRML
jgi:3-oxoacyl-[acyl-carrier protein] reductase